MIFYLIYIFILFFVLNAALKKMFITKLMELGGSKLSLVYYISSHIIEYIIHNTIVLINELHAVSVLRHVSVLILILIVIV